MLLAFMLIYALHRAFHDWSGSATFSIIAYFLQCSMLFLASESLPQILSLINLDLIGDHVSRGSQGLEATSNQ